MRRAIWLLWVLAVLVLLAGCGDDDDSLPETPVLTPTAEEAGELSKDDFISQADGICAEVNAAVGTIDTSSTDTASAIGQKADLYEGMIERIESLGQPDDDAGLSEFFSAGDDLVQAESNAQLAAERDDAAALASAESEASDALASFQSAAEAYGFEECGQGPSAPSSTTTTPPATTTPVTPVPTTPTPVTPVPTTPAPEPTPTPPSAPPSGGAGTDSGGTGSDGGSTGGDGSGSGGIGPG